MQRGVTREQWVLLSLTALIFAWSGIGPYDRLTWLLEVAPVLIGLAILVPTHGRHPLSPLLYRLIFLHAVILMVGGHYTYARVPIGFWVQDLFDFARNHYDRVGHIAQGFVPAILAREILLKYSPIGRAAGAAATAAVAAGAAATAAGAAGAGTGRTRWLGFLSVTVCLAFSALYELIEWWAALAWGGDADSFLATQGDVWDTQWDMFLALCGAIVSILLLSRAHDRSLAGVR